MRSLKWLGVAALVFVFAAPHVLAAVRPGTPAPRKRAAAPKRAAAIIDNNDRMNVNNLDMVVTNHGSISYDLITGNAGLTYPKGSTHTAVFAAGLWLGAKVYTPGQVVGVDTPDLRVAIGEYSQEFTPGPMAGGTAQADNPAFRNFRIVRGQTMSPGDEADYLAQGGPTDSTGNPTLFGDVTIWSVFNDAEVGVHTNMNTDPLGVEVQQTVFAYNRAGPLGNIIFVKWKFINKGVNTLDSTYCSVWSDPDLGGFTDDLVGCDTTLSLGFCYNSTNQDGQYGSRPPAVGYDFFLGPIVPVSPSVNDTLGMTSFNKYVNGTDPANAVETYNYMKGFKADGSQIHVQDDPLLPVTKFQVSGLNPGLPSSPTNWLDSNPGDRRLFLSAGPFIMAPGDSQEVVTAIIIGQGADRIASINDMKSKDAVAQLVFDLNFDICAPPPSPSVFVQPQDKGVRLIWGSEPVGNVCNNAALGQQFNFEGFRIWQLAANNADAQPTVVATYDIANGVTNIYSDEFNAEAGAITRVLKVAGNDGGLQFQIDITQDAIRGGRLANAMDYYYAVTAYSYDANNVTPYVVGGNQIGIVSEVLESARNPIHVVPKSSSAVFGVPASATSTGPRNLTGEVVAEQVVQGAITGNLYRVIFDNNERWTLINVTTGDTLLANQTNIGGEFDTPVTEGFILRATAPRGVVDFGEMQPDSSIASMMAGETDSTGTWHFTPQALYEFLNPTNHDYEIRFLPDTTQFAWNYASGEVSFETSYKVPIEVWDLGFNSLTNFGDDVKMTVMARDRDLSGTWTWGDQIYFRDIPYSSVAWGTPGNKSIDYVPDGSDQSYGRWRPAVDDTLYTLDWPQPTRIRVLTQRFSAQDVFEFRTVPVASAPGTVVGNDVKKVLAVPNPYYAHSKYELTQFDRVMKFTNIPASRKVTIRIFNLAGDLIRTILREATTADEQATATINWDLNTERNLPVASGVYIYRVEVDGVGSKTDRLAVFVEEERLDNF
jgi:hypothetical protein